MAWQNLQFSCPQCGQVLAPLVRPMPGWFEEVAPGKGIAGSLPQSSGLDKVLEGQIAAGAKPGFTTPKSARRGTNIFMEAIRAAVSARASGRE